MISWLRGLLSWKRRAHEAAQWPCHLFVRIGDKGAYCGEVNNEEDATDLANTVVGGIVMETGDVVVANWWTTDDARLTEGEKYLIKMSKTEAR